MLWNTWGARVVDFVSSRNSGQSSTPSHHGIGSESVQRSGSRVAGNQGLNQQSGPTQCAAQSDHLTIQQWLSAMPSPQSRASSLLRKSWTLAMKYWLTCNVKHPVATSSTFLPEVFQQHGKSPGQSVAPRQLDPQAWACEGTAPLEHQSPIAVAVCVLELLGGIALARTPCANMLSAVIAAAQCQTSA